MSTTKGPERLLCDIIRQNVLTFLIGQVIILTFCMLDIFCMLFVIVFSTKNMQRHKFFGPHPLGPWGGPKGQISLNLNHKVNFKDFVCLLTIERYKTYQTGLSFRRLGHAPGVGLGGTVGGGGSKNFFSQIQPDLVCELLT